MTVIRTDRFEKKAFLTKLQRLQGFVEQSKQNVLDNPLPYVEDAHRAVADAYEMMRTFDSLLASPVTEYMRGELEGLNTICVDEREWQRYKQARAYLNKCLRDTP